MRFLISMLIVITFLIALEGKCLFFIEGSDRSIYFIRLRRWQCRILRKSQDVCMDQ